MYLCYFTEVVTKVCLTLASFLLWACLNKIFEKMKTYLIKTTEAEAIPLQERNNSPNEMEILLSKDDPALQRLINAESSTNPRLNGVLRMVNMDGTQDLEERRMINKFFMDTLVKIHLIRPVALIWLKKHIDFETCSTMLSDWKHTGE